MFMLARTAPFSIFTKTRCFFLSVFHKVSGYQQWGVLEGMCTRMNVCVNVCEWKYVRVLRIYILQCILARWFKACVELVPGAFWVSSTPPGHSRYREEHLEELPLMWSFLLSKSFSTKSFSLGSFLLLKFFKLFCERKSGAIGIFLVHFLSLVSLRFPLMHFGTPQ